MGNRQKVWWGGFMGAAVAPRTRPRRAAVDAVQEAARRDGRDDGDDPNFNLGQPTLDELNRQLPRDFNFDIAGFFTVVAGLLNVLAIYDAWGGPGHNSTDREERRKAKRTQGSRVQGSSPKGTQSPTPDP